jgi:hypothetical protein
MSGLGLADLFDLEIRVLEERRENEEARRNRYRNLGRRVMEQGAAADDPAALLRGMLRLDPQRRTAGGKFESAVGAFQALVAIAGILLGGSLSLGLLFYSGEHPVNILNVLAALVGAQLLLLVLLLLALVPRRRLPRGGPVHGLLRALLRSLVSRAMHGAAPERLRVLEERLDAHRGLLGWLLLRAAQTFGVAFNLAALAGCLYRIVFSDVAFGWSTTLQFDAAAFHHVARALSSPWAWLFPHAVPSIQLVQLTQYSHLEGKYLLRSLGERSIHPSVVGGWWPFLLLSIGTYGLVPRLLVLSLATVRVQRILEQTPARNEEFRRLVDWMRLPLLSTASSDAAPAAPAPAAVPSDAEPPLPPPGTSCEVVLDGLPALGRDALDRLVRERFGWTISGVIAPGQAPASTQGPILVLVSAWEEPTKGNQRPLQALPQERLLVVGLLSTGESGDPRLEKILGRWKRHLRAALGERPIRVEPLGPRP